MALIDLYSTAKSDTGMLLKSKHIGLLAAGDYGLFRIPSHVIITDVWVEVLTAFNSSVTAPTATIGWAGQDATDADGFMDAAAVALGTAGLRSCHIDSQPYSDGKHCQTGGAITLTMTAGDGTEGQLLVFAKYYNIY